MLLPLAHVSSHNGNPRTNSDPLPRIGAHMCKAPSAANGGKGSGTRDRAQVGASDLQASPLAEGTVDYVPSISDGYLGRKERGLAVGEVFGWANVGRGDRGEE